MKLYVDLDLGYLVQLPGYTAPLTELRVRKGEIRSVEVRFVQDGEVMDHGAPTLTLALKARDNYGQNPIPALTTSFGKSGVGPETVYTGTLNLTSAGVAAIPGTGASGRGLLELSWAKDGFSHALPAVDCVVENAVYGGTETLAVDVAQTAAVFLPNVTGLTGGGATNLDGLATAGLSVPRIYVLSINTSSQIWALVAGTDAENANGGIVRPDDYNGATNAKVFKRIG